LGKLSGGGEISTDIEENFQAALHPWELLRQR